MIETHIGKKFLIPQKGNKPPLCKGFLLKYLGDQDGLEHWEASITVTFNPNNEHDRMAKVAIGEDGFWLAVKDGKMSNYSKDVQWI